MAKSTKKPDKQRSIKQLIHQYIPLPDANKLKKQPHLVLFKRFLDHPNLWHINRTSVSRAVALGLFITFVPIPFQMIVAAVLATFIYANIPLSVVIVWISNPATIPIILIIAYRLGSLILGTEIITLHFNLNSDNFVQLLDIWQPILTGCLLMSTVSSIIGYFGVLFFWRYHLIKRIKYRLLLRKKK